LRAGGVDEWNHCLEIMGSLIDRVDQPFLRWMNKVVASMHARVAGDTDDAERLALEALQIGTDIGEPDAAMHYAIQYGMVSWQRGTAGDLIPMIEQMAATAPDPEATGAFLAVAYVEADRVDDVRQQLHKFSTANFELPVNAGWLTGMVAYAEAAIVCRDRQYAGALFDRLTPYADQWSTSGETSEGPVNYYLGGLAAVLGRYDEADDHFTRAAALCDRIGAKFDAARNSLLWGRMLADRNEPGDTEKARELLTAAHTAAAEFGYANVERRAAAALEQLS